MENLQGKIIIVTGGAQGIGGATAELCAQRGATVIITDINPEQGNENVQRITDNGGTAEFIQADVSDEGEVKSLFGAVQEKHGKLDGLVCAAGILQGASATPEELPTEVFELVLDINTKGVFLCAKFATPMLEASQGTFVIVTSPAGVKGGSSSLAYGASKGGANGLAMTLERHLEQRNIRVNTIAPGSIYTKLKLDAEKENGRRSGKTEAEVLEIANNRYGKPDGVAEIIAFMLSDSADYLRGGVYTR
jgi:NAD(P)-dependent dehydrogenase (short-subunit alcohol dehydrogenase family)